MSDSYNLALVARQEMLKQGFHPDFPPGTAEQLAALKSHPPLDNRLLDLQHLFWSSIDNDTTRDLDQVEYAERTENGIRVMLGVADVDADVPKGSPIDGHAADQTTSVYTATHTFAMLPEELSTNLTSLLEDQPRNAIIVDITVSAEGSIVGSNIYRAVIRNKAQLTYNSVGPWLQSQAPPPSKVASSAELQQQLRLQDEAASALRAQRHRLGALNFDRVEAKPIVTNGQVEGLDTQQKNRASEMIEDLMVAANEVMARTLRTAGVSSIRRVVEKPLRWPRIVELAQRYGEVLPPQPDSAALNRFLDKRRTSDPIHYADVSLSVIKLLGPGEYVMARPGDTAEGHFGLAAADYTHSTAPNRRFSDLVTQRLIKSVIGKTPAPYSDEELSAIAANCSRKEDLARKVERIMNKRVAAVALQPLIGKVFDSVVTGVTSKGVFVRILHPPAEGRLMQGEQGVDVGDQLKVRLVGTNPELGFIDFGRATADSSHLS